MIVTIARQLGSGGASIGQKVAERLSIPYVDREILQRAAQLAQVSEESLRGADERQPSLLERMSALIVGYQAPMAPEYAPPEAVFLPEAGYEIFRQLVEGAIREIAQRDGAVIVGRGGQVILRENPEALHVYIYAPRAVRIQRIAEREGLSPSQARQLVKDSDRNREGYLRTYYGVDWHDPELYDLIINTARLSVDVAADLVVKAAQAFR
ncbi:MAG: cytidylate kinase-like family protein [Chloroflexi bacterium]|nr:cytidylate kinase-like family protein [Chloroflexota bacterium]